MKKMLLLCCAVLLTGITMIGCGQKPAATDSEADSATKAEDQSSSETQSEDTKLMSGKHHVEIDIKDYGTIAIELDADNAPISVTNFVNLAKEGFYDGLTFHRIIKDFMIQGGDPLGNGSGDSGQTIKGEFSNNGVENPLTNVRGAIAMARSQDKDSASCQFFIVHQDSPHLDGDYAVFGNVTSGMEIVDKICEEVTAEDQNGTVKAENQPVITTIKVID